MKQIFLLFHTLRYLKWQQIYFRFHRRLFKPQVTDQFNPRRVMERSDLWVNIPLYPETLYLKKGSTNLTANFLNRNRVLNLPDDWNSECLTKLWTYNLHYFEDLVAKKAETKQALHLSLLERWIDENPVGYGNGWEPYPISLRIVNIIKAWLGGLSLPLKVFESLFNQASYLSNDLEKHLLGNHYFVNLKALLFAGIVFNKVSWLKTAVQGLEQQIPEQILADGANFELSPMYHNLILVDMLDILNLLSTYSDQNSGLLSSMLKDYIPKMLSYMEHMSHPDGGVAFFNDSVDGIAPDKSHIIHYAEKLGFEYRKLNINKIQLIDNPDNGYMVATCNGSKLIFDAAQVGPDYIPGHAHADTLSFEFSIGSERVFVNSGISEYGSEPLRLRQRKTCVHNTVEVNNTDSSQVWSSFRVAKRARVIDREAQIVANDKIKLQVSHNGYKSRISGCIHRRSLVLTNNQLTLIDSLQGTYNQAISRLFIHPELVVNLNNGCLTVEGKQFILKSDLSQYEVKLADATWYPQFGIALPNKALEIRMDSDQLELTFDWACK